MGMRSTIAYRSKDGTVKMTSVQWATKLDANLSLALLADKKTKAGDAEKLKSIFRGVTDNYDHISSIEYYDDKPEKSLYGSESTKVPSDDNEKSTEHRGMYVNGEVARDGVVDPSTTFKSSGKESETKNRVANFHLDDGIGALYDESKPGELSFFYSDGNGIQWEQRTAADLRDGNLLDYHDQDFKDKFKKDVEEANRARLARDRATKVQKRISELEGKVNALKSGDSSSASSPEKNALESSSSNSSRGNTPKYHVNPETGITRPCSARYNCKFGADTPHYSSPQEAKQAYEKSMKDKASVSLSKKKK